MEWLTAVAIPVAGILGGLLGAWWGKRSARTADIGSLLNAQLEALWSEHPRQRQAARDIIRGLMADGSLSTEQLHAASTVLRHWATVTWDASAEDRRTLGGTEVATQEGEGDG